MAAISPLWKKSLRNQDISNLVDASQVTLSTRAIYAAILKKKHEPLTAESKTLRNGYSKSDLSKVYSLPFKNHQTGKAANVTVQNFTEHIAYSSELIPRWHKKKQRSLHPLQK